MYHVTNKYLGTHVLLKPYIPECPMPDEELDTKRICVAPNVVDCLIGKAGRSDISDTMLGEGYEVFVYRSSSSEYVKANTPDQEMSQEYWYIKPTLFSYVGTIYLDSGGVIQVVNDVELHRKLMVPHHINRFNGLITHVQLMDLWREEALRAIEQ